MLHAGRVFKYWEHANLLISYGESLTGLSKAFAGHKVMHGLSQSLQKPRFRGLSGCNSASVTTAVSLTQGPYSGVVSRL